MDAALKKIISTCLTILLLFTMVARPAGMMLSNKEGSLTFQICTPSGIQVITIQPEDKEPDEPATPTDSACAYFATQTMAMLDAAPSVQPKKLDWQFWTPAPQQKMAIQQRAKTANLTRGPPSLS